MATVTSRARCMAAATGKPGPPRQREEQGDLFKKIESRGPPAAARASNSGAPGLPVRRRRHRFLRLAPPRRPAVTRDGHESRSESVTVSLRIITGIMTRIAARPRSLTPSVNLTRAPGPYRI